MTTQKTFKRRVRTRMEKTGESYTAARRQLLSDSAPAPEEQPLAFEPTVAEERVVEATGHGFEHWFALLDEWGAMDRPHGEIAARLTGHHALEGWYAQSIAVTYERARGLRAVGQGRDGMFQASVSRTVAVPAAELFAGFRSGPAADLEVRTVTPPRLGRWNWTDGESRVVIGVDALDDGRSRIGLVHEKLADTDAKEAMKQHWRDELTALKVRLEAGGVR